MCRCACQGTSPTRRAAGRVGGHRSRPRGSRLGFRDLPHTGCLSFKVPITHGARAVSEGVSHTQAGQQAVFEGLSHTELGLLDVCEGV